MCIQINKKWSQNSTITIIAQNFKVWNCILPAEVRISLSSRLSVWQLAYSLGRRAINSVSQTFLRNSVSVSLFSSQGCRMNFLAILSSSLNTQIHVNYCVVFETDVQLFNLFKVKCYVFTFTIQLLVHVHDYSIGVLKSSTMEIWSGFF